MEKEPVKGRTVKEDRRGKTEVSTWTPQIVIVMMILVVLSVSLLYAVFTDNKDLINILLPTVAGGMGMGLTYLFANKSQNPIVDRRDGEQVEQKTTFTPKDQKEEIK